MRKIIAGSRGIGDVEIISDAVAAAGWLPTVVISGGARGVDSLGESWACRVGVPVERYPADWNTHGKSAGYKRNELMSRKAEALIAVWDCKSRGTRHMIDIAIREGLKVFVYRVRRRG